MLSLAWPSSERLFWPSSAPWMSVGAGRDPGILSHLWLQPPGSLANPWTLPTSNKCSFRKRAVAASPESHQQFTGWCHLLCHLPTGAHSPPTAGAKQVPLPPHRLCHAGQDAPGRPEGESWPPLPSNGSFLSLSLQSPVPAWSSHPQTRLLCRFLWKTWASTRICLQPGM